MASDQLPRALKVTRAGSIALPRIAWSIACRKASTSATRGSGPSQHRQAAGHRCRRHFEQRAACVDESPVAPRGHRAALAQAHLQRVRPAATHFGAFDPRDLLDHLAQLGEVDREEAAGQPRRDRRAHLLRADPLELRVDPQLAERPALGGEPAVEGADQRQGDHAERQRPGQQLDQGVAVHVACGVGSCGAPRGSCSSRMRQHQRLEFDADRAAAFGTRLWLVMPGAVLTSSSQSRPSRSRMMSTRPQPLQPSGSKAASASCADLRFGVAGRPGQMYCVSSLTYLA